MAGDKYKKVVAGAQFEVGAPLWNSITEAAKANEERGRAGGGQLPRRIPADQVYVQNNTGAKVSMYHVLGIDSGLAIAASGATGARQSNIVLKGIVPTSGSIGKFVITAQVIPAGSIGLAWVSGVCAVQVNVLSESTGTDNNYADVKSGETKQLEINTSGAAQILTRNSGTGTVWAVVRLGGTAAASGGTTGPTGPQGFGGPTGQSVTGPTGAVGPASTATGPTGPSGLPLVDPSGVDLYKGFYVVSGNVWAVDYLRAH